MIAGAEPRRFDPGDSSTSPSSASCESASASSSSCSSSVASPSSSRIGERSRRSSLLSANDVAREMDAVDATERPLLQVLLPLYCSERVGDTPSPPSAAEAVCAAAAAAAAASAAASAATSAISTSSMLACASSSAVNSSDYFRNQLQESLSKYLCELLSAILQVVDHSLVSERLGQFRSPQQPRFYAQPPEFLRLYKAASILVDQQQR